MVYLAKGPQELLDPTFAALELLYNAFTHTCLYCHSVIFCITVIRVTRRVKGYTRFVEKYVTGRRKRFRPHKVYIFLIRITSLVDLAMSAVRLSVSPYER